MDAQGHSVTEPPDQLKPGRRIRGLDADQRRDQRRTQLLDAALEVMANNGYLNSSIEQICQVAFVGTKGFYEIFDSKEACYIDLLGRIAADTGAAMAHAMERAPTDEGEAVPVLISVFAHALVDDPRVARVTFGASSGASPAIEQQKRANRRWAAGFVESIWSQYDQEVDGKAGATGEPSPSRHQLAVATIGGMFDLIADWLLHADPDRPADTQRLVVDLTEFFLVVRRGLPTG